MSSRRTLPGIRFLSVLAAAAAILFTPFPGMGAGQTPGVPNPPQAAPGGATSTARPRISPGVRPDNPDNYALQTLWSDHIWQCIPATDSRGLTPDAASSAYAANNWQPVFINSRFGLDEKARTLLARLYSLEKDAIEPGPFELVRLYEAIKKLDTCRSALRALDPQFDAGRAQFFMAGRLPVQSSAGPQPPNFEAIAREYRRCFEAASEADIRFVNDYFLFTRQMDPYSSVAEGVRALVGRASLASYFEQLEPRGVGYEKLRSAYQRYLELVSRGAQVYVSLPSKMHPGSSGKDVRRLQERLAQEGFYSGEATGVYDSPTRLAMEDFQSAHLLKSDGTSGRKTLAWLNTPYKKKAALIAYSLQAVRQSPSRQYHRFIRVNIPQFMLEYYNNGKLEKTDRVVVGRATGKRITRQGKIVGENQTPTLASQIDQIIFNPRWYVDSRIRLELNAEAKSDPEWFARHGYVQMESKYAFGAHRLFQKSGPKNALGRVKFDFPNPYTVYLHDTPKKYLFARSQRDLSHGCIRVDNALELAQTILDDEENPYVQKIGSILKGTNPAYVRLTKPVPISVEYIPVVTEGDGRIFFVGDPYGIVTQSSRMAQQ